MQYATSVYGQEPNISQEKLSHVVVRDKGFLYEFSDDDSRSFCAAGLPGYSA